MKKFQAPAAMGRILLLIALMSGFIFNNAKAQYVASAVSDISPFCGTTGVVNSASIDYTPYCNFGSVCATSNPNQMTAVAVDAGGGIVNFYVDDNNGGTSSQVLTTGAFQADIAIGNNVGTQAHYLVGVVYNLTVLGNTDVYLDIWDVQGQGSGTISIGFVTLSTNISGSGTVISAPHIDIAPYYNAPYPGMGWYPLADEFFITWVDANGVMAYNARLSNPGTGSPQVIATGGTYFGSDVAGVQRHDVLHTPVDYTVGLFTWREYISTADYIQYAEWDPTTSPTGPTSYDDGSFEDPRIDAIDDFLWNTPGGGGNATFTIVAAGNSNNNPTSANTIWEYNDVLGPANSAGDIITATSDATLMAQSTFTNATVACGPGMFYTISYSTTGGTYTTDFFAEQTAWSTGALASTNYYELPDGANVPAGGIYNALSSTCNTNSVSFGTQEIFGCWESSVAPGGKIDGEYAQLSPFKFKTNGLKTPQIIKWEIGPNPAHEYILLRGPNAIGCSYYITDITGRKLIDGEMIDNIASVNIAGLQPGMYMMHVLESKKDMYSLLPTEKVMKFIKE